MKQVTEIEHLDAVTLTAWLKHVEEDYGVSLWAALNEIQHEINKAGMVPVPVLRYRSEPEATSGPGCDEESRQAPPERHDAAHRPRHRPGGAG